MSPRGILLREITVIGALPGAGPAAWQIIFTATGTRCNPRLRDSRRACAVATTAVRVTVPKRGPTQWLLAAAGPRRPVEPGILRAWMITAWMRTTARRFACVGRSSSRRPSRSRRGGCPSGSTSSVIPCGRVARAASACRSRRRRASGAPARSPAQGLVSLISYQLVRLQTRRLAT
jgi:hypothetical protein